MQILDGRSHFYQWDLNQQLTADGLEVGDEVHFSNATMREALVVKAYAKEDGTVVADVPNILFQAPYPVEAFRYIVQGTAEHTIEARTFSVQKRPRPSDYVYTETEVHSIEKIAVNAVREAVKAELEGLGGDKTSVTIEGKHVPSFPADIYIAEMIAALVNSAPSTLDTLAEIATALGNDPNFATTIIAELGKKLDTPNNTYGSNMVLISRYNGEVSFWGFGASPYAGNIAMFTSRKTLQTETATEAADAVNLGQMNAAIGDIAAALDEVHAYAEALKGGATV